MKRFCLLLLALLPLAACSPKNYNTASQKKVVVLGDSYSTFENRIPEGYANWYFTGRGGNDVHDASLCWWSLLCAQNKLNLLYNSSYSGSAIRYTGYDNMGPETSFIARAKTDIVAEDGSIGRCGQKPDILLIFGGTNDDWSGSPLGEIPAPGAWRDGNLYEYFPAVCYLFGYLKERLPDTDIYFILNTDLGRQITRSMPGICEQYGVKCITLFQIDKISNHPSVAGMKKIADQVGAAL